MEAIKQLLLEIGEDPTREGLQDTPKRVMKFYTEFLNPPEFTFTVFDSEGYDEMIVQKDIPFFSL
jgi:GTP cyclohydrolase I